MHCWSHLLWLKRFLSNTNCICRTIQCISASYLFLLTNKASHITLVYINYVRIGFMFLFREPDISSYYSKEDSCSYRRVRHIEVNWWLAPVQGTCPGQWQATYSVVSAIPAAALAQLVAEVSFTDTVEDTSVLLRYERA